MRYTRINPVNRERRKRLNEQNFGPRAEQIRKMACAVTLSRMAVHGWTRTDAEFMAACRGAADPHHVKSRGAGGNSRDLVPVCRKHHELYHLMGRDTFDERFSTNPTL